MPKVKTVNRKTPKNISQNKNPCAATAVSELKRLAMTPIVVNTIFSLSYHPDYLDPTRFIGIFQGVWKRLPLAVRRTIAKYRRAVGGVLMLVEDLEDERPELIAYLEGGRHLCFLDAIVLVPTQVIEAMIAHELAHLYVRAAWPDNPEVWDDEDEADRIASDWGFEQDLTWWKAEGKVWRRYVRKMFGAQ